MCQATGTHAFMVLKRVCFSVLLSLRDQGATENFRSLQRIIQRIVIAMSDFGNPLTVTRCPLPWEAPLASCLYSAAAHHEKAGGREDYLPPRPLSPSALCRPPLASCLYPAVLPTVNKPVGGEGVPSPSSPLALCPVTSAPWVPTFECRPR